MYYRILIPLDGSPLAAVAVQVASLIPSRLVYLLRVEDDLPTIEHTISPRGREVRTRWLGASDDEHLRRADVVFQS